ncbi:2'-5' RNA ligase family protein [Gordonia sp. LSe1-13]|uniref:2'-5' RNA ligase family protein n=1 Tax=Gordonia sesuvii TaxID=3116777 RepID=A0ABU7MHH9_9ACTN|nr:2'-5' RNA ligase family protein [Gordonia sp. LSe1-13]
MVHSIELLLDETADQRVRDEWASLADAGLPHQGSIRSSSNRPHVTLIAAQHLTPGVDEALAPTSLRLPIAMTLGAPILFGPHRRTTLARLVVPSTELLSVHAQTARLAGDHVGDDESAMMPHSAPGRWTPHVTLARRLDPEQLREALTVLDGRALITGEFVGIRHWDSDAKVETLLAGRAC